jgi:spore maturation protein CgeB
VRVLCVFGEHQYGDPARGASLEAACFIPALRAEGHEVRLFDSWSRGRFAGAGDRNDALLAAAEAFAPELVLTVVIDVEVWSETLGLLRARGARTVTWCTDDTWKWRQTSRHIARDYDGVVTTHADAVALYRSIGAGSVLVSQWAAAEGAVREPQPAAACAHQVSFVGIAYGDRRRLVAELAREGIQVSCFGHRWPSGSIAQEDIPRIMRDSVISLNFAKGLHGGVNQMKARVFEVPGAGGFLLTEHAPGLERWFAIGEEVDVFTDADSLAERIRFYLAHPQRRDDMARRAHARTREEHTYRQRMRAVVEFARGLAAPPARADAETAYRRARARDRAGPALRFARWALIGVCALAWGRARAPARARRIAFEASWRLWGASTYRAGGWFGRMFP